MKKVISFSGGRTSAYLCKLMKDMYGDDVDFVFMDTGAEHPRTYDFIRAVNKEFDLNLTCLRTVIRPKLGVGVTYKIVSIDDIKSDLKPFMEMMGKYGRPYFGGAFCTSKMKVIPFQKYCKETYGLGNFEVWLGIRVDEPKRLKSTEFKYLADISDFEKEDILDWWSDQSFDLQIEEWLGNCVFCVKKGVNKIALALKDEPELFDQFNSAIKDVSVSDRVGDLNMYRKHNSLEGIKVIYEDVSRDELASRIKSTKSLDTGACSESCEVGWEEEDFTFKKIVSFSGGRTSAYLCKLMKDEYGDEVDFVFMDTGAEHPNTYDFIRKVDKEFKLNLKCLKTVFDTPLGKSNNYELMDISEIGYNLDTWKQMLTKYSTPYNPSGSFCSIMLKGRSFYKFCDETYGKGRYVTWLGIRSDEAGRLKEKENVDYLASISDFDKSDILAWWKKQPFDLDLDSDILGNCVFCIKRRANKTALATRLEPELATDFINLVEDASVRHIEGRKAKYNAMYRGQQSLETIRDTYSKWAIQDIEHLIRGRKETESECSESCEVGTIET